MTIRLRASLAALAGFGLGFGLLPARAQPADEIEAHLAAAKKAAAFDFAGTLVRTCVAPQTGPGRDVAPAPAPDRATYVTDPAKVFDNLYFVGTKIHSSWALTTSAGIILIDTLYEYASEEAIVGGLTKLGLDPRQRQIRHRQPRPSRSRRRRAADAVEIRFPRGDGRSRLGRRSRNRSTSIRTASPSATSSPPTARR